jgi:hypothetical protein
MSTEINPKSDKETYLKAIEVLEFEIENLENTKTLDTRLQQRLEAALEDAKAKLQSFK